MPDTQSFITTSITVCYVVCVVAMATVTQGSPITSDYLNVRDKLLSMDRQMRIGGHLKLNLDEQFVNDIIMEEKNKQIDDSRLNRMKYIPAQSFFYSKPRIENSTLLKLIRRMPKGAALHLHDTSAASLDWLVKNATYRENVHMCVRQDGLLDFWVFVSPPSNDCEWMNVSQERARALDVDEFDQHLKNNLSLLVTDPTTTYPDNARIWVRFVRYFSQVQNLVYYRPIFRDYFWQTLEEFRADNVQYIELRSNLKGVFDLDGTVHDAEFAVQVYKQTVEEFVRVYPDFSGAKIIMSGLRNSKFEVILSEVKTAVDLNQKYPDVMMGYDMVGNEAFFNPIIFYIDALLYPSGLNPPYKLPYFLHVGETNWQGTPTDDNILDAILLNVTRIGHGYALPKRPKLLQLVRDRDIAIEVNPLSNQILRLVNDLRNHPMVPLMADNYSIVISSDDFAVWDALPLSHDIYMAFTVMCGQDADLTFLKQLAINSIKYSSMTDGEKDVALRLWEKKWDTFIQQTIMEYYPGGKPSITDSNLVTTVCTPSGTTPNLAETSVLSLLVFALCCLYNLLSFVDM